VPNYTSDIYLGTLQGHTGSGANASRFNGSIAEIILYNLVLNDAQRIIVNNYLSAKYDVALATHDVYKQDDAANGNYDHEVAGIGRTNSSNIQSNSQGTSRLRVNSPSNLGDDEFLMWGHNNATVGTWGSTDMPPGVQGRWHRVWRFSELSSTGTPVDVGAINLTFDLNGLGAVNVSDLRLLVDSDNDNTFADETPIAGAVDMGSGFYRFAATAAITNGRRMTLGTSNAPATPLPVELLSFSAQVQGQNVELDWTTASELNNDHFTVERSPDLALWSRLLDLPGVGNSTNLVHYQALDRAPLSGTGYYRLAQYDVDGTETLSNAVVVHLDAERAPFLYPNPAHDRVTLYPAGGGVRLVDALGHTVPVTVQRNGDRAELGLMGVPPGMYFILSGTAPPQRLIVE
jgi:hypothetical protein